VNPTQPEDLEDALLLLQLTTAGLSLLRYWCSIQIAYKKHYIPVAVVRNNET